MKKIMNYIFIFILLILSFNIGLYISCSFDSKLIEKKIKESYEILNKEGMFYKVSNLFNIQSDNSADALIMNECYSVDSSEPYLSYMKVRKSYKKNLTFFELPETVGELSTIYYVDENYDESEIYYNTIAELGDFLNGRYYYFVNYGRYWHGYLVFFRPLLLIFNILQIRHILFLSFSILFITLIYKLYKEFNINISIIFALSLICSGYFSASYLIGNSLIFIIMMISSLFILAKKNKIKDFGIFIFIIGCLTSFVDYLNVPLITLGMPCAVYILELLKEKKDWKYCTEFLIKSSFIWVFGYAFTWISKWILYDLTINDHYNMISIGFGQVFFRMQRVNEAVGLDVNYISVITKILNKSLIYIIISVFILLILNKFKISVKKINKNSIPFLILSLYPIIWFVVLANHTILHAHFVYRHSLLFMLGVLLVVYQLFFVKEVKNEKNC